VPVGAKRIDSAEAIVEQLDIEGHGKIHAMPGSSDATELRQLLRDALAARLAPGGWEPIDNDDRSMTLGAFVRPINEDFAATVEYTCAFQIPDAPPIRITQTLFGVSYEPLRRLWPLLGDFPRVATLRENVGDMPEWTQVCGVEVSTPETKATADRLVGPGLDHALAFAERHADVDVLLEATHSKESGHQNETTPALLAAAGRFDAARHALAQYRGGGHGSDQSRRTRRFVYQLTRFIESSGDQSLLPTRRPPGRFSSSGQRPMADIWREVRARNDAAKAIKPMVGDHDRTQLRVILESELAKRGVGADPLWIQRQIDDLFTSRAERRQQAAEGLKVLGKLGLGAANAIRKRELPELPDMSVPAWVEPPSEAVYAVPQSHDPSHRWTAVELDEGSDDWLARVHAAVPRLFKIDNSPTFDAWLDWGPTDDEASGLIAVHIGERRVGSLDDSSTVLYRPVMDAATERAELPCVQARVTPGPEGAGYLLEVALPAARPAPAQTSRS
jgi:hypothetical protein